MGSSKDGPTEPPSAGPLLWAVALAGAATMIVELTATRALAPYFGSSLYTWTNVIGIVLGAMAVGAWVGGRLPDRLVSPRALQRLFLVSALALGPAVLVLRPLALWILPAPDALVPVHAVGHTIRGSLLVSVLCFAPPVFLLAMVSPWVIRIQIAAGGPSGRAAGSTLALSTLGSLAGTYLPAHLLIEWIGIRGCFLVSIGLLVLAAVLCGRPGRPAVPVLLGILLLCGGSFGTPRLSRPRLDDPAWGAVLEQEGVRERETAYQHLRISGWGGAGEAPELRLSLDEGVLEFHSVSPGPDGLTGHYYDRFVALLSAIRTERPLRVAILGGGVGTMAHQMRHHHPERLGSVVNVEIDPGVLEEAPAFGIRLAAADSQVAMDARAFLAASTARFDLVVLDAYSHQIEIPFHLATREFFELVASRLAEGGIFALNVSVPDLEAPLCKAIVATLKTSFAHVGATSWRGAWNVLVLATKDAPPLLGAWPARAPEALRPIAQEMQSGFVSEAPGREDGMVLTDDRAPLFALARAVR